MEVLVARAWLLAAWLGGAGTPAEAIGEDRRAACLQRNASAPERYRGLVRALCADHHNLGGVGASVAVGERGALRFVATAGQRCAGGPAVAEGTAFRLGSLTKLTTAALVMTAVDAGQVRLDEAVVAELGWDDRRAEAISLRQLLSHSAGLGELWPRDAPGDDAWLAALTSAPLVGDPGLQWRYSNVGYALVGAALESVTGEPHAQALQRRVLAPLGLRRATVDPAVALAGNVACGHLGRGAQALPFDVRADLELGAGGARWAAPAGGLIAPASEVVELVLGLVDPLRSPLSAAAIEELLRPQVATDERPGESYALGVRVQTLADGSPLYLHRGDTGDFTALLYFAPARGFALVVLGNTGDALQATAIAGVQELLGVRLTAPAQTPRSK